MTPTATVVHLSMFIFLFSLTVLIRTFKHVKLRTFIYAILTMILLPILIALIIETTSFMGKDDTMMSVLLFFYLFTLVISLQINKFNRYSHFLGICVILFSVCSPFLPFYIMAYLEEVWHWNYNSPYRYIDFDDYFLHALWFGVISYYLLLGPVFRRIYARLWALPVK